MSDIKNTLSADALANVAGGECTPQQYIDLIGQLTRAYEQLIDFTSYVMGRVSGDPPVQP
jgi:hypothetical protein